MSKIKFLKNTHQYIDDGGRELISVSKFTDKFKEKVDWGSIAQKYAAKETRNRKSYD